MLPNNHGKENNEEKVRKRQEAKSHKILWKEARVDFLGGGNIVAYDLSLFWSEAVSRSHPSFHSFWIFFSFTYALFVMSYVQLF